MCKGIPTLKSKPVVGQIIIFTYFCLKLEFRLGAQMPLSISKKLSIIESFAFRPQQLDQRLHLVLCHQLKKNYKKYSKS